VTDPQMKDLEDRVIARHGLHGDWNYTILPVPRPAPDPGPEPAPLQRPAPDPAVLDQPALTGLPPGGAAALFGCDRTTISHELPRIGQLLAATATTIPPGPVTLATYQDLRDYAATTGITLPDPAPTPPARHASNPRHAANSP
jgi:hypothetical protein